MKKYFINIKNLLRTKYVKIYELLVMKLLLITTRMMHSLILMKGKDPDFNIIPSKQLLENHINETAYIGKVTPTWVCKSFKNVREHPLYNREHNLDRNTILIQEQDKAIMDSLISDSKSNFDNGKCAESELTHDGVQNEM